MRKSTRFTLLPFRRPGRDRELRFPRKTRDRVVLKALRAGFGPLSFFCPAFSALCAERLFRTPPRPTPRPREREILQGARHELEPFRDGWLATWTFGVGPAVLLAHGWGGHSGRLSRFVDPLLQAGFSVISFDGPAHGQSSGKLSSMPDFVAAVETLARSRGPLAGIVGHSLGAAAAALAVRRGLHVPGIVLLAAPANPENYAAKFAQYFRIPAEVRDGMKRRLERRYSTGWMDLRLDRLLDAAPARLLVFHDRGDCRVPWKDGAAIAAAWPGAELVETRGLGHHKILRDPAVIAGAVDFLAERALRQTPIPEARPETRRRRRDVPIVHVV